MASLFLDSDPLGLRGRLSFFYSRPAFNTAAEVRAANNELNAHAHLADDLATFFWPCRTTHDPVWAGQERFVSIKAYPFRLYQLSPDAQACFDEHFDLHVAKQKEAHLADQEKAKFHGKAKTKHIRLAFALHLFEQTRLGHTSENWSAVLDKKHLVVALQLGDYLDSVAAAMQRFFATVITDTNLPAAPPGKSRLSVRDQLAAVLDGDWAVFAGIDDSYKILFWKLAQEILRLDAVWIVNTALTSLQSVAALLGSVPDGGATVLPRVANLLQHLQLVVVVKGNNTHGTPLFYIVKRHLLAGMLGYNHFVDLLGTFEVALPTYKTFDEETVKQHQPPKAAGLPRFAAVAEQQLRDRGRQVAAWHALALASAAAPAPEQEAAPAANGPRRLN